MKFLPPTICLDIIDASGNSSSYTPAIIVQDTLRPSANCFDIIVSLDNTGTSNISTADIDDGSFDNCSFEANINKSDFDCFDIGVQSITLTLTDVFGNMDSCIRDSAVVKIIFLI